MKTYFAKYLPVEGEIKEGDRYRYKGYPMTPLIEGRGNRNVQMIGKPLEKVKLFLCSEDIQVGDNVIDPGTKNLSSETVLDKEDLEFLNSVRAFKVIGEISPEAVWVKEGDEFDRPDFEAIWRDELGNLNFCAYDLKGAEQELIIRIKCPTCKTFH